MEKIKSTVLLIYLIAITFFCAYLGLRYAELHDAFTSLKSSSSPVAVPIPGLNEIKADLEKTKSQLSKLTRKYKRLSLLVANLPDSMKQNLEQRFVPNPRTTVPSGLFVQSQLSPGIINVVGNLSSIQKWEKANELFLDYIYQESMSLDFDRDGKVIVANIDPHSVFAQMGLQSEDVLIRVDGQMILNPDDFRMRLLEQISTALDIKRKNEDVKINIRYQENSPDQVEMPLSLEEFHNYIPELSKTITLAPTGNLATAQGAKIVRLEAPNPFLVAGLKPEDILLKIGDISVTPDNFTETLAQTKNPIVVTFHRESFLNQKIILLKE